MKAIVAFDRDKLKWITLQLNLHADFAMGLDAIKRRFSKVGKVKFPHIIEVEVYSFEVTGEKSWSWSSKDLPDIPTIEECISENRANIIACLSKL